MQLNLIAPLIFWPFVLKLLFTGIDIILASLIAQPFRRYAAGEAE
jgi:hypothetical protein